MTAETVHAVRTIPASPERVFDVLADPAQHSAIDGTGWVTEALDPERLTAAGQVFAMSMFHPNHPDGDYQIYNVVQELDRPRRISWRPGYLDDDGELAFGGWVWAYDLRAAEDGGTEVTLTYDWSQVPPEGRTVMEWPPFPPEHLPRSLAHLEELVLG